jgi:NAD+ kinase
MKFGIVFYSKNLRSRELCIELIRWLVKERIDFALEEDSQIDEFTNLEYHKIEKLARLCEFLIVIGGDGSILRASRYCARFDTILVGLHRGTTGFLTQLEAHNMFDGLSRILAGDYQLQRRLMLQASVIREGRKITSFFGLNDAVLKVVSLSRIVTYRLYANDVFVEDYPGDGILISTPTGSTGYSLSNGGPIVKPEFGLLLMSPICTHKFNARPMIFSDQDTLKICIHQENSYVKSEVVLTVDGQVGFHLKSNDEVIINSAPNPIKMAEVFQSDFFELIRTKID